MKKSLEESHLNDTQKYILFVLENVLEIAEKMNLKCYMQGGTMLGAIRHKGYHQMIFIISEKYMQEVNFVIMKLLILKIEVAGYHLIMIFI